MKKTDDPTLSEFEDDGATEIDYDQAEDDDPQPLETEGTEIKRPSQVKNHNQRHQRLK